MSFGAPDWGRYQLWARVLAGPGKADGVALVYRARRVFTYSVIKLAVQANAYALVTEDHDIISSATLTWDATAYDTDKAIDHDDDTYAFSTTVMAANTVREMLIADLGEAKDVFIYVRHGSVADSLPSRIYVSEDCSTWALIDETGADIVNVVYHGTIRCIKWEIANTSTISLTPAQKLYSIEVYEPADRTKIYFNELTSKLLSAFIDSGYYFLYENIFDAAPAGGGMV